MDTGIEADFAGQKRRFDLLAKPKLSGMAAEKARLQRSMAKFEGRFWIDAPLIESMGGESIPALAKHANSLSFKQVASVLVFGLACGDSDRLDEAQALLAKEMETRSIGELEPLAISILAAAYAGAASVLAA